MSPLTIVERYSRKLPHIPARLRPLFITYSTFQRWHLPPGARTLALKHVLFGHPSDYYVHVVVVMPDHVHLVMTLPHALDNRALPLAEAMKGIKGVSSRRIKQLLGRQEPVWLIESYDHIVRRSEGLEHTCEYVLQNPVRAGLVANPDDYPWLWRAWLEGKDRGLV